MVGNDMEKCSECSRRKWYQRGYEDGLNADKWIPCSKELPKEEGFYLVSIESNYLEGDDMKVIKCFFSEKQNAFSGYKVTAWQPLPKSYKQSEAK